MAYMSLMKLHAHRQDITTSVQTSQHMYNPPSATCAMHGHVQPSNL